MAERFNDETATQYAIVPEKPSGEWMMYDFAPTLSLAKATAREMFADEYNDGTYSIAIVRVFEATADYQILTQYDDVYRLGGSGTCNDCFSEGRWVPELEGPRGECFVCPRCGIEGME